MSAATTAREAAATAAEAIRSLNHQTHPGVVQIDAQLDVVDVYDVVAELALLAARLPQLLTQLDRLVERLVEDDRVRIVNGPHAGDPVAVAVVAGHWLTVGATAAGGLAHALDRAHQVLADAATNDPASTSPDDC